jgi:hypothetical protein
VGVSSERDVVAQTEGRTRFLAAGSAADSLTIRPLLKGLFSLLELVGSLGRSMLVLLVGRTGELLEFIGGDHQVPARGSGSSLALSI